MHYTQRTRTMNKCLQEKEGKETGKEAGGGNTHTHTKTTHNSPACVLGYRGCVFGVFVSPRLWWTREDVRDGCQPLLRNHRVHLLLFTTAATLWLLSGIFLGYVSFIFVSFVCFFFLLNFIFYFLSINYWIFVDRSRMNLQQLGYKSCTCLIFQQGIFFSFIGCRALTWNIPLSS